MSYTKDMASLPRYCNQLRVFQQLLNQICSPTYLEELRVGWHGFAVVYYKRDSLDPSGAHAVEDGKNSSVPSAAIGANVDL